MVPLSFVRVNAKHTIIGLGVGPVGRGVSRRVGSGAIDEVRKAVSSHDSHATPPRDLRIPASPDSLKLRSDFP